MKDRSSQSARRDSGQALVEASAILIPISVILTAGLIIMLGIGQYMSCQMRVQYAAQAGAQAALNSLVWCGATSPNVPKNVDANGAAVDVGDLDANTVSACLKGMGLTNTPAVSSPIISTPSYSYAGLPTVYLCSLEVDYPYLPPAFSSFFPAKQFSVVGKATVSTGDQTPNALAYIYTDSSNLPTTIGKGGLLVPAYSKYCGAMTLKPGSGLPASKPTACLSGNIWKALGVPIQTTSGNFCPFGIRNYQYPNFAGNSCPACP